MEIVSIITYKAGNLSYTGYCRIANMFPGMDGLAVVRCLVIGPVKPPHYPDRTQREATFNARMRYYSVRT